MIVNILCYLPAMSDEEMETTTTTYEKTLITRTVTAPEDVPDTITETEKHVTRLDMPPQFTKPLYRELTVEEGGVARYVYHCPKPRRKNTLVD